MLPTNILTAYSSNQITLKWQKMCGSNAKNLFSQTLPYSSQAKLAWFEGK